MRKRIRYRYLVPLTSLLPERLLRWLDHHLPIDRQPLEFGWSFWTDASYAKTCRRERREGGPEFVETFFEDES